MGKSLDKLKELVSKSFKEGASPEQVKAVAEIEQTISLAEQEEREIIKTNGELTKAYKDLINATSGNIKEDKTAKEFETKTCPSFDEALKNYRNGLNIEGTEKRKGD